MSILKWDQMSEKLYETGTDRGVLYPYETNGYGKGVAWNGLTGVSENPEGAEATKLYANNGEYLSLLSAETFGGSITAYTYPDEFSKCDGSAELVDGVTVGQQTRQPFGLSYRTIVGNDTESDAHGYKIHLVYGCKASVSSKEYKTINDSPEAIEFSWDFTTTPVDVPNGLKKSATVIIDSTKVTAEFLKAIEAILYGTDPEGQTAGADARLPLPEEIYDLYEQLNS